MKKVKSEGLNNKKKRKTLGMVVSGCLITKESMSEKVKTHLTNQKKINVKPCNSKVPGKSTKVIEKPVKIAASKSNKRLNEFPVAGPSHIHCRGFS